MLKTLRKALLDTSKNYLLRDLFQGDAAAGTLNGTPASGGPGTRTVVDTNSKISVSAGVLNFATGAAANDAIWYDSVLRAAGRVLIGRLTASEATNGIPAFGWDSSASGAILDAMQFGASGVLNVIPNGGTAIAVGAYTANTYDVACVMRGTGLFWFLKGGAFTNWALLWTTASGTAAGFPAVQAANTTAVFTAAGIRIPLQLWIPRPIASDGFSGTASDGLGHAEQNGGNGLAWTGATWTVAAGAVTNSPTLGSELLVNGGFDADTDWVKQSTWSIAAGVASGTAAEGLIYQLTGNINTWYGVTFDLVSRSTGGVLIVGIAYTTPATGIMETRRITAPEIGIYASNFTGSIDNVSYKPLTLSSLFASLAVSTPDVLAEAAVTLTAGTQAGLVLNLDDAATPANFVIAYHNGTNCLLEKCVAGVYATVINAAATYSAGAVLRVIKDGTAYRLYYNNALVGTGTISDAGIVSNVRHGLFSTYAGNSFDNFVVWNRGTDGSYSALDAF